MKIRTLTDKFLGVSLSLNYLLMDLNIKRLIIWSLITNTLCVLLLFYYHTQWMNQFVHFTEECHWLTAVLSHMSVIYHETNTQQLRHILDKDPTMLLKNPTVDEQTRKTFKKKKNETPAKQIQVNFRPIHVHISDIISVDSKIGEVSVINKGKNRKTSKRKCDLSFLIFLIMTRMSHQLILTVDIFCNWYNFILNCIFFNVWMSSSKKKITFFFKRMKAKAKNKRNLKKHCSPVCLNYFTRVDSFICNWNSVCAASFFQ